MRAASLLLRTVLLTGSLPVIAACSNERAYNIIQENRWQACAEQPIPLQASCRAEHEMSFADYERLREAAAATDTATR